MQLSRIIKSVAGTIDGEAWLRFIVAVAGLGLAFLSAIASTAMRESGNSVTSIILASMALVLAGVVGITTVPYLARRVRVARVSAALDYQVTREGVAYLGVALIVGVAALNTTNNLLFIVLAAMLAAIAVSGLASAAVLRGLELEVAMPERTFAEQTILARVRLANPRRWVPAFSVRVATRMEKRKKPKPSWEWYKTEFVFPRHRPWLHLRDYSLRRKIEPEKPPEIFGKPVYFTFIPPGTTGEVQVDLTFPRRGLYAQDTFYVATRFPFSFLMKIRRVRLERELLVYPPLLEESNLLDVLPMITGEFTAMVRGRGSELYRIREHTPEDPARFVDWKATAKTSALKVREFTREDERHLRMVFDNAGPGAVPEAAYEQAVSRAASLAWHFAGENVDLTFLGRGGDVLSDLHAFLAYLAVIQPAAGDSMLESLPVSDDYNVIITARPPGSIPSSLWATSYVIYMQS
ncbi:MAG TPA: DUF58 domain-containing protein [Candidatus Saccharimonadales bacterium]|jgi:uncharacterized protein (DUF58 family)|nr:DUF58 domain-containing protein [Candidatus Saccharimonadales bacterium]